MKLSDDELQELNRRAALRETLPRERDRLEMRRLSNAGWSIPRVTAPLGQHHQTVRRWIKAYLSGGFDALSDLPHGGNTSALTPAVAASPELSAIEPIWHDVKPHRMNTRSYSDVSHLMRDVNQALNDKWDRLTARRTEPAGDQRMAA